jgi:hypothetical protein
MARKMKLFPHGHSLYDYVVSSMAIATARVVVDDAHDIISGQVGLAMTMFIKVQKSSLVIKILICC